MSLRESVQLGDNCIGTEHILLGMLREGDGVAAQVLVTLGADLNRIRQQVIQLVHGYQSQEVESAGPRPGGRAPAGLPGDALARFDALDRRLTALERWVSMQPDLEDLDQEIAQVRRDKQAAAARRIPGPLRLCATRRSSCSPTGLTGRRSGRGPRLAAGRWPGNWTG